MASLAMPSALLGINGSKDALFDPDEVLGAFDKLTACYRKATVALAKSVWVRNTHSPSYRASLRNLASSNSK